jgi:hypothetical protein
MISIIHTGTISEIAHTLPIASWLYKTKNKKIVFIFPEKTNKIDKIVSLLKLQKYTENVILVEFDGNWADIDPNMHFNAYSFDEKYFFKSEIRYPFNITDFYANKNNLGVDADFFLNLDLDFKYVAEKVCITSGLVDVYPHYEVVSDEMDMLSILREFAYAKERKLNFNEIAVYFSYTKIPFYLYLFKKENGFYVNETKENFWLSLKNASILDIKNFGVNRKIISIYDKIYFN